MARSVAEHKELLAESDAMKYLRENGWLTLYRSDAAFDAMKPQLEFGAQIGVAAQALDTRARSRWSRTSIRCSAIRCSGRTSPRSPIR